MASPVSPTAASPLGIMNPTASYPAATAATAATTTTTTNHLDPFAIHRTPDNDPFAKRRASDSSTASDGDNIPKPDRRLSKEWDAAKTPPSRFQKVEGSIYATPASRDGGVARNKIYGFKEKVKELSGKK